MITTFQAIAVVALALLPGALYTFAFERVAGAFGVALADRVLRFLAATAVLWALASGPMFLLYEDFILSGRAARGELDWRWVWAASLLYVVLPTALGSLMGVGSLEGWRWTVWLTGNAPEPRAWDHMWRRPVNALLRIKLKSGPWIGGIYQTTQQGVRSYAAGYPQEGDLHLTRQLVLHPDTGEYAKEADGTPTVVERGLLIRWSEVEYLDIQEF